jgi:hypothetical protein
MALKTRLSEPTDIRKIVVNQLKSEKRTKKVKVRSKFYQLPKSIASVDLVAKFYATIERQFLRFLVRQQDLSN